MTITATAVAGRTLISSGLFDVLVGRTIADFGVDPVMAPRVVDQALAFLAAVGRTTSSDGALTPSKAVDPGWHAFLMYSRPYRARAGYVVDPDLWHAESAKCGQCHEDGNFGASGGEGDENSETRYPDK